MPTAGSRMCLNVICSFCFPGSCREGVGSPTKPSGLIRRNNYSVPSEVNAVHPRSRAGQPARGRALPPALLVVVVAAAAAAAAAAGNIHSQPTKTIDQETNKARAHALQARSVPAHTHTLSCIYEHTHTHTHAHVHAHSHVHARMHTQKTVHGCAHTHTHTHTHTLCSLVGI